MVDEGGTQSMDRSFPLAVYSSFSPFATANSVVSLVPRAVTGARVTRSATATRSPPPAAPAGCVAWARRAAWNLDRLEMLMTPQGA